MRGRGGCRAAVASLKGIGALFLRLVAARVDGGTSGDVADVVLVVLGRYYRQVAHEELIGVTLAFEELSIVLDIIDAWEYFLKVTKSELLLLKV